jgi:catechol-2,3-dioxygenase
LQHVALNVAGLRACERFYCEILGMQVVWRPDGENVYLTNGADNLALHEVSGGQAPAPQRLDHIGFALQDASSVDDWYRFLSTRGVSIVAAPRTHRDGTRSLYCHDPEGNTVQLLYEPRFAEEEAAREGSSDQLS